MQVRQKNRLGRRKLGIFRRHAPQLALSGAIAEDVKAVAGPGAGGRSGRNRKPADHRFGLQIEDIQGRCGRIRDAEEPSPVRRRLQVVGARRGHGGKAAQRSGVEDVYPPIALGEEKAAVRRRRSEQCGRGQKAHFHRIQLERKQTAAGARPPLALLRNIEPAAIRAGGDAFHQLVDADCAQRQQVRVKKLDASAARGRQHHQRIFGTGRRGRQQQDR